MKKEKDSKITPNTGLLPRSKKIRFSAAKTIANAIKNMPCKINSLPPKRCILFHDNSFDNVHGLRMKRMKLLRNLPR